MLKTHRVVALLAGLLVAAAAPVWAADFEKYIPDDTEAVIKLNVKQVLAAPMLKDVLGALAKPGTGPLKELGFDPFTDLDHVIIAVPGGGNPEKSIVLVQGKFNVAKFEAAAEAAGKADLKIHKIGTSKVYEAKVPVPQIGEHGVFLSFVDGSTIAVANSKDSISDTIDRREGKKKGTIKKEMKDLLGKMDSKLSLAVAILGTVAGQAEVSERVDNITGGISLVNDIKLDFVIATKSAETAKELEKRISDGIEQAKGILPLIAAQQKQLAPVVDLIGAIKVAAAESNVTIKAQLSKEDIEKAIKKAGG